MRTTFATTWVLDSRIHHSNCPATALEKTIQPFLPNAANKGNPNRQKPYNGKAFGIVEKNKVHFPFS